MDAQNLEQMYIIESLSQRDIAKKLNISQSTVKYYLNKYKIVKNSSNSEIAKTGKSRICPHCSVLKTPEEFYYQSGNRPRQGSWCKKCMNTQVVIRQRKYKQQALDYKGGKCKICGYNKCQGALEFHHRDPSQKDLELSKFSRTPLSEDGKKELDKCDLLCANCHREAHSF